MKRILMELNKQRSLDEIMELITSKQVIERISTLILSIFVALPMLTAFFNQMKHNLSYLQIHWYNANLVIGFFGIVILCLLVIKRDKKSLKQLIKENPIKLLLLGFLIWTFVSAVFAKNKYWAIMGNPDVHGGVITYVMYFGIFVLASGLITNKSKLFIMDVFVATAFVMEIICIINNHVIMAFFNFSASSGNFTNINHYGYYLVMTIMACVLLLVNDDDYKKLIVHVIELGILTYALVRASSMGPLLAVIIGIIGYTVFGIIKDKNKAKQFILIIFIFSMTTILSSINTWNILNDFKIMFQDAETLKDNSSALLQENANSNLDAIGSSRGQLWRLGIQKIVEKPIVGYGGDNYQQLYIDAGFVNQKPHNEFIEISLSFGLPVLFFYLSALVILLIQFFRYFKQMNLITLGLYCIVGAYLFSSFFGNSEFYTAPLYILLLAMTISSLKQTKMKSR